MKSDLRRYVILGSGVAGVSAAEAIRRNDPPAEILIISREPHGYYSRPGLAYFLTGEVPEEALSPLNRQVIARLKTRLLVGNVVRIDPPAHRVLLDNRTFVSYSRLLIASGATAAPIQVPGAELEGVVKLDNLDDARRIAGLARQARAAVVVGGGITALELVEGLVARGVHTHYFLRGSRYWSNVLDEIESQVVEHKLREDGAEIHPNTELAAILGKKGRVAAVQTRDNRVIPCEIVGVAIGILPRKELAESAGLKTERGVLVNEYLQTSDPDIFAAGDAAQVYDPRTGKYTCDSLWSSARTQGSAAGQNMSGVPVPYHKGIPFNVTRLAGLTTTILGSVGGGRDADVVGIMRGDSESWRIPISAVVVQSYREINRIRILVGAEQIEGALIMGDQKLSRPLEDLIVNRIDITPIRSDLLNPGAPVVDLIMAYWYQWKTRNAAQ